MTATPPRILIADGPQLEVLWVFQGQDGSQVLVEKYSDGTVDAATRPDSKAVWGPPLQLLREERP